MNRNSYAIYRMVPLPMILSDLAKYSMTCSIVRCGLSVASELLVVNINCISAMLTRQEAQLSRRDRETARCFVSLNISTIVIQRHSKSFEMTYWSRACLFIPLKLCLYLLPFLRYLTSNRLNAVTLKYELEVTQGHWKRYHLKAWYGFLFAFHSNYGRILYHFRDKARYWSKIAIFSYPVCIRRPRYGQNIIVEILHRNSVYCDNV